MSALPLHVVEELLRLDNEGRLPKICRTFVNGHVSTELRAEPKVQIGGPAVKVTYGYDGDNNIVSEFKEVIVWDAGCEALLAAQAPPSGTGAPPNTMNFPNTLLAHQEVVVSNAVWTPIPNTANRLAIAIQNNSGEIIKVNGNNTDPITEGVIIQDGGEREYGPCGPGVDIYLVSLGATGVTVDIEELV